MASINHFPTFYYSQPDEYRFSHDSVFLARRVFEFIQVQKFKPKEALDLCAGCGVVGLDLLFHLRSSGLEPIKKFDFLEIQSPHAEHFAVNRERLGKIETQCEFILGSYADVDHQKLQPSYDLIVCNPPYFSPEQGKLPASELKLRSRFFVDSDLQTLFQFIHQKLSFNGQAFVLIRDQREHKQDQLSVVRGLIDGRLEIQKVEDIRGTNLLILSRFQ